MRFYANICHQTNPKWNCSLEVLFFISISMMIKISLEKVTTRVSIDFRLTEVSENKKKWKLIFPRWICDERAECFQLSMILTWKETRKVLSIGNKSYEKCLELCDIFLEFHIPGWSEREILPHIHMNLTPSIARLSTSQIWCEKDAKARKATWTDILWLAWDDLLKQNRFHRLKTELRWKNKNFDGKFLEFLIEEWENFLKNLDTPLRWKKIPSKHFQAHRNQHRNFQLTKYAK